MTDALHPFEVYTKIIEIAIGVLIPITVLVFGYLINVRLKEIEARQGRTEALLNARLEVFKLMRGDLNKIFCANAYVGTWLDISPTCIIECKRRVDSVFYSNLALFDREFVQKYFAFVNICFSTYRGKGAHAVLRADVNKYIEAYGEKWDVEMGKCFLPLDDRERWMEAMGEEIGSANLSYSQDIVIPSYCDVIVAEAKSLGVENTKQSLLELLQRPATFESRTYL